MPRVGALDDPAARPTSHTAHEQWFAASADVRTNAAYASSELGVAIVIALVETQVHGAFRTTALADYRRSALAASISQKA